MKETLNTSWIFCKNFKNEIKLNTKNVSTI